MALKVQYSDKPKANPSNPKDFFKTISAVGDHKFPYKLL
jgi:hypothetical protein